ncbi:MAG: hypothetical protein ABMA64_03750 [Myxococcota bacterium]
MRELVVFPPTRHASLRAKLQRSDARLSRASDRLRSALHALTPSAQVDARPYQWLFAAVALGALLGWLGQPNPPRRLS